MDSDLSQDQRDQVIQRVEELIGQMDGFLVFTDDWGERKLAYDIKKRARGYYVRFDYCGLSPLVSEIERFFRIDDRALKYMTVLLDDAIDLEKIKAEQAEAASRAEAEKEAQEASRAMEAAPVADAAPVAVAVAAPVEDVAPVADATPVEDVAPVEEKTQEDVAPTSDVRDSAADTTLSKNPEEA
jgi:small subunit ribosomal protein S6